MDAYNADPRGLRKKKHGWVRVLQDYAIPIVGVSLFLCICVMVALHGRAAYWQRQAAEHQGHHHRWKNSHSTLQQALQLKEQDLRETHQHRQSAQEQLEGLQHQLEAESRQLASVRTELHTAQAEAREARQVVADAKHDLNTCLDRMRSHGDISEIQQKQVGELKQRVAAHEARELQLLSNKQQLEVAVERWKAQAEQKGVHLEDPAGMAGLMTHGLGAGAGAADLASLPTPLVPSAPPVDGVQPASRMLGVQPTAAVPKAPLVAEHLDPVPKPTEEQRQRPAIAAPDL